MLKKSVQDLRCVVLSVIGRIELQKNSGARLKMIFEIGEKEIPLRFVPTPIIFAAAVKGGREASNQIKLSAKIRQLFKAGHLVNHSINAEKLDQAVEDGDATNIEPEAAVSERFGHEEKKAAAAADIQNLLGRKSLQVEVLGPPDIDPKPLFEIEVLRIVPP